MSRDDTLYARMGAAGRTFSGQDVSTPAAGFFRGRLRSGAVTGGIRIWHGPPHDPVTGEEMDRSWRWQAEFDGDPVEFDDVWPACSGSPISERDYRELCARRRWARENAQNSAFANPKRRYDPLSNHEPLPF